MVLALTKTLYMCYIDHCHQNQALKQCTASVHFFHLGVGGIEAEAVMLGQAISMVLPNVVGYKLTGQVKPYITSTDVVLTITKVCKCLYTEHIHE